MAAGGWADSPENESSPEPNEPRRIVKVTGDHNYPPYCYLDNGIPSGFDIDIIRAIARAMALDLRIELYPWNEARRRLEAGEADVVPGLARIAMRESRYEFTAPTKQLSFALFVRNESAIRSLEEARDKVVLVQQGGVMSEVLHRQAYITNLLFVADAPLALQRLAEGVGDAAMMNRVQGVYLLQNQGERNIRTIRTNLPGIPYCLATTAGNIELRNLLNAGLVRIKESGEYEHIYEQWFGHYNRTSHREVVRLALSGAAVAILLVGLLLLWTRSLQRQVQRRTQELSQVIDLIPHPIFARDRDGRYVLANQAAARAISLPMEDIIGLKPGELGLDESLANIYLEEDARVFEHGQALWLPDVHYVDKEGQNRHLQISKIPFRPVNGTPTSVLCVAVDVSALKQTEEALRANREYLAIILNAIAEGVIAVDADLNITLMNPVASRITRWPERAAVGRPLSEVIKVMNVDGDARDLTARLQGALASRIEDETGRTYILSARDGGQCDVAIKYSSIINASQAWIGLVLVLRDTTDENRRNQRMQEAQKMESIGRLAGGVAHDFNNLLTGIIGYTELLGLSVGEHEPARNYLTGILDASERARDLVNQLLTFSRRQPGELKPVNVHTLIGHVTSLLQHTMDRRISIVRHLDASSSLIMGDRTQLQNALLNLGVNARDAMPSGGTLTFHTENREIGADDYKGSTGPLSAGMYLVVRITDTGVGMDRETLVHIFEPFYTTKGSVGGVGLGLPAVYGTVKEHQGFIEVISRPGRGTIFELGFPLYSGRETEEERCLQSVPGRGSACILIVDDETYVQRTISEILVSQGYQTRIAANGREALALYRAQGREIDLVILDMIMPEMNGEETFRALQEINPRIKAIICSGFLQDYHRAELTKLGILDVLEKPFRKNVLLARVESVLRQEENGGDL